MQWLTSSQAQAALQIARLVGFEGEGVWRTPSTAELQSREVRRTVDRRLKGCICRTIRRMTSSYLMCRICDVRRFGRLRRRTPRA